VSTSMADEPVTVVVTRRVKPGHEPQYEAWLRRLVDDARGLPGFLGTDVQRPAPGTAPVYTSVFRFDSVAHLQAFEGSELRARALAEVREHVEADATWRTLTGLEFWFTVPAGTAIPQPVRWRMALVMIAVVYVLVLSLGRLVALAMGDAPMSVRLLVTIAIEVLLMTYVLMPRLTRVLAPWIYPRVRAPGEPPR
jgi:uncharacterized protein